MLIKMDRLREYQKRQQKIIDQASRRMVMAEKIWENKTGLERVSGSLEQYRIDFANSQNGLDGWRPWKDCPDPVYRKLGEAITFIGRNNYSISFRNKKNIDSILYDFAQALRRRRGMSEEQYHHILETPVSELVQELSDKVDKDLGRRRK